MIHMCIDIQCAKKIILILTTLQCPSEHKFDACSDEENTAQKESWDNRNWSDESQKNTD